MSFYALKTYFICIKRSILHSPNSPNSPNSRNTRQTHLSQVWRVLGKWLGECPQVWRVLGKRFGECRRVWWVLGKWFGECRRVWRALHISKSGHFGEYSHSPKTANFWRVLEFAKFAPEWPFLRYLSIEMNRKSIQQCNSFNKRPDWCYVRGGERVRLCYVRLGYVKIG